MSHKENPALLTEHARDHLVELYDSMGLCHCGDPGAAWRTMRDVLLSLRERRGYDGLAAAAGSEGAAMFVVTALDAALMTEHGTSHAFSWLTPKGDWFLDRLLELGDQDVGELLYAEEPRAVTVTDCGCAWKVTHGG